MRLGRRRSSTSDATPGRLSRAGPRTRDAEGRDAAGTAATCSAGIDVPKGTLDGCPLPPGGRTKEAALGNDPRGHAALVAWADRHAGGAAVHSCLEATGPYPEAIATHLAGAGRLVSVVNPTRIKSAGPARGRGNTTDKADAKLIAGYAQREHPPAGQPPAPGVRELQGLVRRIDDLTAAAARDKGRLASPARTPAERQSVPRAVRFLEREAGRLRAAADAPVAATPALAAGRERLESIPGVGRQTATVILAELPAIVRLPSAPSAAAYCGLPPREFTSGTSVRKKTRRSEAGNPRVRTAVFLPTRTAVRFNPPLRGFFGRLVAAGKPKVQAVGACLRKLVMICYGVLKNRAPFDPAWSSRIAP